MTEIMGYLVTFERLQLQHVCRDFYNRTVPHYYLYLSRPDTKYSHYELTLRSSASGPSQDPGDAHVIKILRMEKTIYCDPYLDRVLWDENDICTYVVAQFLACWE